MACFLVSAAEAVVVTAAAQIMKNSEMKADSQKLAKKAAVETKQEKHPRTASVGRRVPALL